MAAGNGTDQDTSDGSAAPTTASDSHSFVDRMERFDLLFEAGFRDDPVIADAIARVERLLEPPRVVDAVLQSLAHQFAQNMREDAAALFGPLYYTCMRSGWSAAEAVLHVRGTEIATPSDADFEQRFAAVTGAWSGTNPWESFSDLAYYLLDDLTPTVRERVREVMAQSVPHAELPDNWDMIPPLRGPLDTALNGVLVGAAAALAAAGHTSI